MADNSKEEFLQLVKRFGAFITLKISNLFQRLDSRSVATLAVFALGMVAWRVVRAPSGQQRRQPKRQANAPSSSGVGHANADSTATVVASSSEDSSAQDVIDEFFQLVKPTLGQIVRQRLSEGRKVTCRLLGVILEETSPEELQKQATVRSSVLEVLLEITKFCDLYLMERVIDDESEIKLLQQSLHKEFVQGKGLRNKKVLLALEDAGVFTSGGLVKDKVLFCSTENGRTSFVRQLEPDWHIDSNPEIVNQLARFIKYQLHISPTKAERSPSNVFCSASLEQFFGGV